MIRNIFELIKWQSLARRRFHSITWRRDCRDVYGERWRDHRRMGGSSGERRQGCSCPFVPWPCPPPPSAAPVIVHASIKSLFMANICLHMPAPCPPPICPPLGEKVWRRPCIGVQFVYIGRRNVFQFTFTRQSKQVIMSERWIETQPSLFKTMRSYVWELN